MKKFEKITAESLSALTCDCCGRESVVGIDDFEVQEFVSIDFVGGYQSIFGDGNHVTLDICQYCLKDKLGAWLNIKVLSPETIDPEKFNSHYDMSKYSV